MVAEHVVPREGYLSHNPPPPPLDWKDFHTQSVLSFKGWAINVHKGLEGWRRRNSLAMKERGLGAGEEIYQPSWLLYNLPATLTLLIMKAAGKNKYEELFPLLLL